MFRRCLVSLVVIALCSSFVVAQTADRQFADMIVGLERGALDRWGRGDPEGYLELYARDVTYFDPMRDARIDGADAMRRALAPIKGMIKIDRYELIAPHVDRRGDVAILTYNLVTHGPGPDGAAVDRRWNSTVVYVRIDGRWRILHSHWSHTKPEVK